MRVPLALARARDGGLPGHVQDEPRARRGDRRRTRTRWAATTPRSRARRTRASSSGTRSTRAARGGAHRPGQGHDALAQALRAARRSPGRRDDAGRRSRRSRSTRRAACASPPISRDGVGHDEHVREGHRRSSRGRGSRPGRARGRVVRRVARRRGGAHRERSSRACNAGTDAHARDRRCARRSGLAPTSRSRSRAIAAALPERCAHDARRLRCSSRRPGRSCGARTTRTFAAPGSRSAAWSLPGALTPSRASRAKRPSPARGRCG